MRAGGGEGEALLEIKRDAFLEHGRAGAFLVRKRHRAQQRKIRMLRAEGERAYKPCPRKRSDAAARKPLGARAGKGRGEFQDEIRPVAQRETRTLEFIERGGFPALHEAAAERDDRMRAAGKRLRAGEMVSMSIVEGIIFGDHADRIAHKETSGTCGLA